MDSHYIIERLKTTQFKYPTMVLLQNKLDNLEEERKQQILSNLKKQIYMERNVDIQKQLSELVYRMPVAS